MTAAHCICKPFDPHTNADATRIIKCLKPDNNQDQPTFRVNQHIPLQDIKGSIIKDYEIIARWRLKKKTKSNSFNHFTVQIGSKDSSTGVYQLVKFAYTMYIDMKYSNKLNVFGCIICH